MHLSKPWSRILEDPLSKLSSQNWIRSKQRLMRFMIMLRNGRNLIMSVPCSCGKRLNQKFTMNQRVGTTFSFLRIDVVFGHDWPIRWANWRLQVSLWSLVLGTVSRSSQANVKSSNGNWSFTRFVLLDPITLLLVPLLGAIAAGCTAIVKVHSPCLLPTPLLLALHLPFKLTLFLFQPSPSI